MTAVQSVYLDPVGCGFGGGWESLKGKAQVRVRTSGTSDRERAFLLRIEVE